MESRNFEEMEPSSLEIVLKEFEEEQKSHTKSINDLVTAVNGLAGKLTKIEGQLDKPKEVTVHTNTKPIEDILKKGTTQIQLLVSGQPKTLTKRYQLLLFPERDAKLFYKIVFSRWFMWMAIIVFLHFLYNWAVHRLDNNKEVEMQRFQNDRFANAWEYLYKQGNKGIRKLMDSAWVKSANE